MVREFVTPPPRQPKHAAKPRKPLGKPIPRTPLVTAGRRTKARNKYVTSDANIPALSVAEKRQTAVDLRLMGHSLDDIGRAIDLSVARVSQLISEALADLAAVNAVSAGELREMELARLDRLLVQHWGKRADIKSSELILKILERRHKLSGIEVQQRRTELSGPGGGPIPITVNNLDITKLNPEQLGWLDTIIALAGPQLPSGQLLLEGPVA